MINFSLDIRLRVKNFIFETNLCIFDWGFSANRLLEGAICALHLGCLKITLTNLKKVKEYHIEKINSFSDKLEDAKFELDDEADELV